MHCDETDDPLSRHIETLAYESRRLGLHGRVAGSHLHVDAFDGQLLRLEAPAPHGRGGGGAIANPLVNAVIKAGTIPIRSAAA